MSDNMYYWQKFLDHNKNFKLNIDSYILYFKLENKIEDKLYSRWLFFPNRNKCLQYIKYIVLPSSYFSKILGMDKGEIILDSVSQEDAIEMFNFYYPDEVDLYNHMVRDYRRIRHMEKDKFHMKISEFENSFNSYFKTYGDFNARIRSYENINKLSQDLLEWIASQDEVNINRYFNMEKNQLIKYLENPNKSIFTLKRLSLWLSSKRHINIS